jgi:hypothetical protein
VPNNPLIYLDINPSESIAWSARNPQGEGKWLLRIPKLTVINSHCRCSNTKTVWKKQFLPKLDKSIYFHIALELVFDSFIPSSSFC